MYCMVSRYTWQSGSFGRPWLKRFAGGLPELCLQCGAVKGSQECLCNSLCRLESNNMMNATAAFASGFDWRRRLPTWSWVWWTALWPSNLHALKGQQSNLTSSTNFMTAMFAAQVASSTRLLFCTVRVQDFFQSGGGGWLLVGSGSKCMSNLFHQHFLILNLFCDMLRTQMNIKWS